MERFQTFYREHKEILETISELNLLLKQESIKENSESIVDLLASLSGKLQIHLAMEDKYLYPLLLRSKDSKLHQMADDFSTEMGDIGKVLKNYINEWGSITSLAGNPIKFINESNEIFRALKNRIKKEEKELYPLAEKVLST
jgi:hemerythrin-like domain-containing protein